MQGYSRTFARVYERRWSGFATGVAPMIREFYETIAGGQGVRRVLDLCCGTGQLAVHFLSHGYRVVGVDLSRGMLDVAEENAQEYVKNGRASFIEADATDFSLDETFGLVVCVFDSLNHLPDEEALARCFECVSLVCGGVFVFDLNTRAGLLRCETIHVDVGEDDVLIMTRGLRGREPVEAWTRMTGFCRSADYHYERYDETIHNRAFPLERVRELLLGAGWKYVCFSRGRELGAPVEDPEREGRIFVIASKSAPIPSS